MKDYISNASKEWAESYPSNLTYSDYYCYLLEFRVNGGFHSFAGMRFWWHTKSPADLHPEKYNLVWEPGMTRCKRKE